MTDGTLDLFGRGRGGEASPPAPPPRAPAVWSPTEVNRAVRRLLETTLPPLWVAGEVANWTRARSGHRYFTLKDDQSQLRCVMWRRDALRLPTDPQDGMRLRAFGTLGLYEGRGEFQFAVRLLEGEEGEGLWRLAFRRLQAKLEAEGLLAPERKRPLPPFPRCVGVVTSPTGAAIHDILTVLERRAPWTRVVVRSTRVQGEGAADEIAAAVTALARSGLADVVIVGRGGGSMEDLWAFNEEGLARAISSCPVPVISAVGHEADVTIADLVADLRAPTPSAAAEAAVRDAGAILELLERVRPRLARGLRMCAERRRAALASRGERLERSMRALVEGRRRRLARGAAKVEALSPLSTLRRGYAVPLDSSGRVLRRTGEFPRGSRFSLRVVDGRVACLAEEAVPGAGEGAGDG